MYPFTDNFIMTLNVAEIRCDVNRQWCPCSVQNESDGPGFSTIEEIGKALKFTKKWTAAIWHLQSMVHRAQNSSLKLDRICKWDWKSLVSVKFTIKQNSSNWLIGDHCTITLWRHLWSNKVLIMCNVWTRMGLLRPVSVINVPQGRLLLRDWV